MNLTGNTRYREGRRLFRSVPVLQVEYECTVVTNGMFVEFNKAKRWRDATFTDLLDLDQPPELDPSKHFQREYLRRLVDATWSYAFEDTSVPSTAIADKIINSVAGY